MYFTKYLLTLPGAGYSRWLRRAGGWNAPPYLYFITAHATYTKIGVLVVQGIPNHLQQPPFSYLKNRFLWGSPNMTMSGHRLRRPVFLATSFLVIFISGHAKPCPKLHFEIEFSLWHSWEDAKKRLSLTIIVFVKFGTKHRKVKPFHTSIFTIFYINH